MNLKTKINSDSLVLGTIIGLIVPVISVFIYFWLNQSRFGSFENFFDTISQGNLITHLISICAVPNLLFFYLFLNREKNNSAKGIIFATLLLTILVLLLKLA
jgi:hypothetical protein